MVRIPDCRTYKSLAELPTDAERLAVAEETGRGLAIYGELTAGMDPGEIVNPLPGYRDTGNYYHQLHSVLNGATTSEEAAQWLPSDETLLHSTGTHFLLHLPRRDFQKRRDDPALQPFIRMALEHQEFALTLQRKLRRGEIRTLAIHGDTKLDNFLFCNRTGRVKALIDLDTIMPHTWLADWGDMVRSLANVAGEREQNLEKVQVDQAIFLALAKGFLAVARKITQAERELMVDAVRIIALELGVRFLADYLRGDSYFRLGPADTPELNRIRAMAQLTLFQRLTEQRAALSGALQEVDKQSAE
ncbi:MAG TPA: phosphotransferase, partial [Chthonomonadales bacterium]|nr:phosphotransferase [Chthonomonadales bacterium]